MTVCDFRVRYLVPCEETCLTTYTRSPTYTTIVSGETSLSRSMHLRRNKPFRDVRQWTSASSPSPSRWSRVYRHRENTIHSTSTDSSTDINVHLYHGYMYMYVCMYVRDGSAPRKSWFAIDRRGFESRTASWMGRNRDNSRTRRFVRRVFSSAGAVYARDNDTWK